MMRILFQLLLMVALPSILVGQSIKISTTAETSANGMSVYPLANGANIQLKSGTAEFLNASSEIHNFSAIGFSQDRSVVGLVSHSGSKARVTLLTSAGDTLNSFSSILLRSNDPSLAIHPTNSGHSLIRDNVMNFTFQNGIGAVEGNLSTGSSSEQGETVTEVSISSNQETTVLYTPKIKRGDGLGSKVELLMADQTSRRIFQDQARYIKSLELSDDGALIAMVTVAEGTEDKVIILDKYGNKINSLTAEEELSGASLSAEGKYVTLFSESRVWVYNSISGKNLGSASPDGEVFTVDYFPEDERLFIASGNYSEVSGVLQNIEVKIVLLDKRAILSENYSGALRFHEAFNPTFKRISSGEYELKGANKHLLIELY